MSNFDKWWCEFGRTRESDHADAAACWQASHRATLARVAELLRSKPKCFRSAGEMEMVIKDVLRMGDRGGAGESR